MLDERTSIAIAHRLVTVRHADRIIVLDHGRIVEEGSHDWLMARGGHYAELYNTYFRHQSPDYRPPEVRASSSPANRIRLTDPVFWRSRRTTRSSPIDLLFFVTN